MPVVPPPLVPATAGLQPRGFAVVPAAASLAASLAATLACVACAHGQTPAAAQPAPAVTTPTAPAATAAKPAAAATPAAATPAPATPAAAAPAAAAPAPTFPRFVKSGNVSAWNISDVAKVFADARRLGLDTITVPVRVNMAAATSGEVKIDGPSLAFAQKVVATSSAYRYIIEPYPWIDNGNVPETDLNPTDKAAWFASYQGVIVALAKEFPRAWGLYIASNLVKIEDQSAAWLALVKVVRAAYTGKIIYRTQWWATAGWEPSTVAAYKAKVQNPLFAAVDVIAIAAYFELTETVAPTLADIKAALRSTTVFDRKQDVYAEVMALQAKWGKPIFLGELSCPAVDFGAKNPWDPAASDTPNPAIQRNYLEAYLQTFAQDPAKFLGFSLFTIGHPTVTPYELAPTAVEYVRGFRPPVL